VAGSAPADRTEIRGGLPVALDVYVSRSDEHDLSAALSRPGLITLTGPGGVGKTRLAVQVGSLWAESTSSPIWLVDLSPVRGDDLVASAVAGSARVAATGTSPAAALARFIGDDPLLLVLDNCEHVTVGCAQLVATLLGQCARLRVLATSRAPLAVTNERILTVSPLALPDDDAPVESVDRYPSVALFVERARHANPNLSVTPESLELIGRICRRLDGLPLAIELAAARTRALSLGQVLERLDDRFRILTGRQRPGPARQQTLLASIQWSYDLCTRQEQLVWARLAVFADGCQLDAIEGVCAGSEIGSEEILDILESLIEKSIVTRIDHGEIPWYRMLEAVREFGVLQLTELGEAEPTGQRQREWYEGLLRQAEDEWISPRQTYWLSRMAREINNLRVLTQAALELSERPEAGLRVLLPAWRICWWALGRNDELRHWLELALARATEPTPLRARGLLTLAYLSAIQRRPDDGSAALEEGRQLAKATADRGALAFAAAAEGLTAEVRNDVPASIAGYERALELFPAHALHGRTLHVMGQLSAAYERIGDTERANELREKAVAISIEHGERFERGLLLFLIGVVAWQRGETNRAEDLIGQCLRLKRDTDDRMGIVLATQMLAATAASAGDASRAGALLSMLNVLWRAAGADPATLPLYAHVRDETTERVRSELGDAVYAGLAQRAAGASPADAVAFALRERTFAEIAHPTLDVLTGREREIADLIAQGLTNRQISSKLVISLRTAEGHAERIRAKLEVTSRRDIARYVRAHGSAENGMDERR
jgi:non-specific serine/threonine protein kinase